MKGVMNMKNNVIKMVLFGLALSVASPAVCWGSLTPAEEAVKQQFDAILANPKYTKMLNSTPAGGDMNPYFGRLTAQPKAAVTSLIIDAMKLDDFRFLKDQVLPRNTEQYASKIHTLDMWKTAHHFTGSGAVDLDLIRKEISNALQKQSKLSIDQRNYRYVRSLVSFVGDIDAEWKKSQQAEAFIRNFPDIEEISSVCASPENLDDMLWCNRFIIEVEKNVTSFTEEQTSRFQEAVQKFQAAIPKQRERALSSVVDSLNDVAEKIPVPDDIVKTYEKALEELNRIKEHRYKQGKELDKMHKQLAFFIGQCLAQKKFPLFVSTATVSERLMNLVQPPSDGSSFTRGDHEAVRFWIAMAEESDSSFVPESERTEFFEALEKARAIYKERAIDLPAATELIEYYEDAFKSGWHATNEAAVAALTTPSVFARVAAGLISEATEVINKSTDSAFQGRAQALKAKYEAALQEKGTTLIEIMTPRITSVGGGGGDGNNDHQAWYAKTSGQLAIVGGVVAAVGLGYLIYRKWQNNKKEKESDLDQEVGQATVATDFEG